MFRRTKGEAVKKSEGGLAWWAFVRGDFVLVEREETCLSVVLRPCFVLFHPMPELGALRAWFKDVGTERIFFRHGIGFGKLAEDLSKEGAHCSDLLRPSSQWDSFR